MNKFFGWYMAWLTITGCTHQQPDPNQKDFRVPDGFEVIQFADDSLATDIYKLAFDRKGRVLVSGPGYIKRLYDTNRDGKADSVSLISRFPEEGARGLYDEKLIGRIVWAVSRSSKKVASREFLTEMTQQPNSWIARETWEAVNRMSTFEGDGNTGLFWLKGFDHDDRRVRAAAYRAARGNARVDFIHNVDVTVPQTPRQWLGYLYSHGPDPRHDPRTPDGNPWQSFYLSKSLKIFTQTADSTTQIDALRLMQMGLGDIQLVESQPDVKDGYKATGVGKVNLATRRDVAEELTSVFPTGVQSVDHEIARLMAILEVEDLPAGFWDSLTLKWTEVSPVEQDIHYLLVAMRLPGNRMPEITEKVADAVVGLHVKMKSHDYEPSRYWPGRIGNMLEVHLVREPGLAEAVVDHPDFRLAGHAQIANVLPDPYQSMAAKNLLQAAIDREERGEHAFTPGLINFVSVLPTEDILPVLRPYRDDPALRASILSVFADYAEEEDRQFLIEALTSRQTEVVTRAAEALRHLPESATVEDKLTALRSLAGLSKRPGAEEAVLSLSELLHYWIGSLPEGLYEIENPNKILNAWTDWFAGQYPEQVSENIYGEETQEKFSQRLGDVSWENGSAARGKQIFIELSCQGCHVDSGRLGPNLQGIGQRFDPADLMRIVNNPDQIQWDAFQVTEISTREGESLTGILIYDSPAVRILQTRDGRTVHVSSEEILEIRESPESLMPGGLLQELTARELADLYAFIETL